MGGEPGLKLVQSERSLGGAVVLVRVEVKYGFARVGEGATQLQHLCGIVCIMPMMLSISAVHRRLPAGSSVDGGRQGARNSRGCYTLRQAGTDHDHIIVVLLELHLVLSCARSCMPVWVK